MWLETATQADFWDIPNLKRHGSLSPPLPRLLAGIARGLHHRNPEHPRGHHKTWPAFGMSKHEESPSNSSTILDAHMAQIFVDGMEPSCLMMDVFSPKHLHFGAQNPRLPNNSVPVSVCRVDAEQRGSAWRGSCQFEPVRIQGDNCWRSSHAVGPGW